MPPHAPAPALGTDRLYAEDFTLGRRFPLGSWLVTEAEIMDFATAWDPLPIHTDLAYAQAGPFDGLIASGLHTVSIAVRLTADAIVTRSAVYAGRELKSIRMRRPVRPGSILSGTVEITEQRLRDDGRGVVVYELALVDEAEGDVVLTLVVDFLVHRRGEG